MKSFYEKFREDHLEIQRNGSHHYPAHFHQNLEIFIMKKGHYGVSVNENRYEVKENTVVVVDSYDIHEYERKASPEDDCVIIIPYKYLSKFNVRRKNFRFAEQVLYDGELCDRLLAVVDTYMKDRNSFVCEAAVELFLAILSEKLDYSESKGRDEAALVRKILAYLQENFRGDVSRNALSKELGYTPAHLSRVFHRYLSRGITEYVNGLRYSYIERLRDFGDTRTILELIYESGFKSQQTYYRYKKSLENKENKRAESTAL